MDLIHLALALGVGLTLTVVVFLCWLGVNINAESIRIADMAKDVHERTERDGKITHALLQRVQEIDEGTERDGNVLARMIEIQQNIAVMTREAMIAARESAERTAEILREIRK
jgi:lipopolysaccharide export LptBFGC system permease protein LptF